MPFCDILGWGKRRRKGERSLGGSPPSHHISEVDRPGQAAQEQAAQEQAAQEPSAMAANILSLSR